jgi:hypothetical protein
MPAIRYQLFKRAKSGSLMSFDSEEESDSNSLRLYAAASTGRNVDFTINFTGQFATHNDELRIALDDRICNGFSADFKDVETTFTLIPAVAIAGRYLVLFCSITRIDEETSTCMDGVTVPGEYQHSNAGKHERKFHVTRLREFVDHVMVAARAEVTYETQQYCSNTYAASVVFYHELSYFRHALKHGHLRDQVCNSSCLSWVRISHLTRLDVKESQDAACRLVQVSGGGALPTFEKGLREISRLGFDSHRITE